MLLALVELEHFGSDMFLFLPPQDVFERRAQTAFTDVDLAFIRSGKFGIAEVKSSPRAFDANDLERIAAVAEGALALSHELSGRTPSRAAKPGEGTCQEP